MSVVPLTGIVKRAWIPLIVLVVLAVSGLVVSRLHRQFASQNLNANAGAGIEIVQFNPKIMIYDVYGSGTAQISYFDPWSFVVLIPRPPISPGRFSSSIIGFFHGHPDHLWVLDVVNCHRPCGGRLRLEGRLLAYA